MNWVLFLRGISGLLSEGMPMALALRQVTNGYYKRSERLLLQRIQDRVSRGEPFLHVWVSVSRFRQFRALGALSMVPSLVEVLDSLADYLERFEKEKSSFLKQIRYPLLLMGSVCVCFVVIFSVVLPGYLPLLETIREALPFWVVWLMDHQLFFIGTVFVLFGLFWLIVACVVARLWRQFHWDYKRSQFCFLLGLLVSGGLSFCAVLSHFREVSYMKTFSDRFWSVFSSSGDVLESFNVVLDLSESERSVLGYYFLKQDISGFLSYQSRVYRGRLFSVCRQFLTWFQPILMGILVVFVFLSVFVSFLPMLYSGDLV